MGKCNKVNEIDMGIMEMEMFSCKIQQYGFYEISALAEKRQEC